MKRTSTKKTKSLPSCKISKKAREKRLQPKVRIFRASAAIIGITVSVGTPNLLLTQAASLPQVRSNSTQGDRTTPEIVQLVLLASALPVETPQVVPSTPYYSPAEKATAPIYNHPAPVVESSAPKTNFTPALQPSKELVPQPLVVNTSLALRLRQHQQASALERTQAVVPLVDSNAQQNFAPIEVRKAEVIQNQVIEIVPNQVVVASSPSEVRSSASALALSPVRVEANSGWTAKQRLLVDRLKNRENPSPLNNPVVQVPNNIDLAPPVATLSQPAVVAAPNLEGTLLENLGSQALVPATSDQSNEFAAPLQTEVVVLPQTQSNQDLAATPTEVAAAVPEQLALSRSPVFVLPKSAASSANTIPTEIKAVDEQQIATQVPEAVENSPSVKEIVTNVNEPIIVSTTTSEYQVKPGDTLITIASAHRLSLPEVAKFNHLSNPDLLLVDQKIKIPSLNSITTQANVAVLPPIEKEPTTQINSLPVVALPSVAKVSLVATAQEVVHTNPPAPAYTGVGGNIPGEAEAKPLEPTALNDLQVQYAQKLQNDVQKLKQKYHAQNSSNPTVLVRAVKGEGSQQIVRPSAKLDDEPINPEFQVAQTYQDLKPVTQKQLINRVNYSTPARVGGRVATAPVSGDSNESFPARQVIPELPPLDPAMNYLPQPNGVAPLNGYIWPARGALTSRYGYRWGRMHRGIDIAAPVGTPIFAAAPGVVIKSGWNKGGYGNLVDIQHADGSLTRYAHNYRLLVQPGQFVDQGQQISLMGNTGRSTGPHLHFEVHPGGKGAVNPIALLPKSK